MAEFYILVDGEPKSTNDIQVWARWYEDKNSERFIAKTDMAPGIVVSTVFLGIDHAFGDGPPVLFETMVFGGDWTDQECHRYSTITEARRGHLEVVTKVIEQLTKGEK